LGNWFQDWFEEANSIASISAVDGPGNH